MGAKGGEAQWGLQGGGLCSERDDKSSSEGTCCFYKGALPI